MGSWSNAFFHIHTIIMGYYLWLLSMCPMIPNYTGFISEIQNLMRENKLKLNGDNTEMVLLSSQFSSLEVHIEKIQINNIDICPVALVLHQGCRISHSIKMTTLERPVHISVYHLYFIIIDHEMIGIQIQISS